MLARVLDHVVDRGPPLDILFQSLTILLNMILQLVQCARLLVRALEGLHEHSSKIAPTGNVVGQ